jgi:hypothetical protein
LWARSSLRGRDCQDPNCDGPEAAPVMDTKMSDIEGRNQLSLLQTPFLVSVGNIFQVSAIPTDTICRI